MRGLALVVLLAGVRLAIAAPPGAAKRAREHFQAGEQLLQQQRFDDAIRELEAAYDIDPQPVHVYNLGVAHQLRGDDAIAIEYYRLYLLDAPAGSEARKAATFRLALENKAADARAETHRKALEEQRAKASQTGGDAEMVLYAQYIVEAETKERRAALIADDVSSSENEVARLHAETAQIRAETETLLRRSRRWERYVRQAPSGDGHGLRMFGSFLVAAGAASATVGVHDVLARETALGLTDHGSAYLAIGAVSLVGGLACVIWGESKVATPRESAALGGLHVVPTLGAQGSGVSLQAVF